MKSGKIPMRMCVGCGEMKPKSELVRVVKTTEGEIKLDKTGKLNGRGAYICREEKCLLAAQKAKRFEKAFSSAVPEAELEKIAEELK
ncbi:MAG: YlxR family protein [Ruminococcaceae bacterium]|nr:YlxR family protein [Oscillospiraceae bacterium]